MLILAVTFAALTVFGMLIGQGTIGQPIGSHGVQCYGWALAMNAAAVTALAVVWDRRSSPRRGLRYDEDRR